MKVPWKKDVEPAADPVLDDAAPVDDSPVDDAPEPTPAEGAQRPVKGSAYTPGKGRPTPKRKEAERRKRGPVSPPPTTRAEARARRKEIKATMTKEERKARSEEIRRKRMAEREAMMAGDEDALMPRDRGPVRRHVRNVVDSRRNFAGLFLPFAIVLIVLMFIPSLAAFANLFMLAFVLLMIVDSIVLGRIVNNRVRERFPDSTDTGFRLGWYAFTRAMQVRKMRAPRPQVGPGDSV